MTEEKSAPTALYFGRKRTFRKLFDTEDSNVSVNFPLFIQQLEVVAGFYKVDSIKELISNLHALCLAEGVSPNFSRLTVEQRRQKVREKKMLEKEARLKQAEEKRIADLQKVGSFPDRVANARKRLGDF